MDIKTLINELEEEIKKLEVEQEKLLQERRNTDWRNQDAINAINAREEELKQAIDKCRLSIQKLNELLLDLAKTRILDDQKSVDEIVDGYIKNAEARRNENQKTVENKKTKVEKIEGILQQLQQLSKSEIEDDIEFLNSVVKDETLNNIIINGESIFKNIKLVFNMEEILEDVRNSRTEEKFKQNDSSYNERIKRTAAELRKMVRIYEIIQRKKLSEQLVELGFFIGYDTPRYRKMFDELFKDIDIDNLSTRDIDSLLETIEKKRFAYAVSSKISFDTIEKDYLKIIISHAKEYIYNSKSDEEQLQRSNQELERLKSLTPEQRREEVAKRTQTSEISSKTIKTPEFVSARKKIERYSELLERIETAEKKKQELEKNSSVISYKESVLTLREANATVEDKEKYKARGVELREKLKKKFEEKVKKFEGKLGSHYLNHAVTVATSEDRYHLIEKFTEISQYHPAQTGYFDEYYGLIYTAINDIESKINESKEYIESHTKIIKESEERLKYLKTGKELYKKDTLDKNGEPQYARFRLLFKIFNRGQYKKNKTEVENERKGLEYRIEESNKIIEGYNNTIKENEKSIEALKEFRSMIDEHWKDPEYEEMKQSFDISSAASYMEYAPKNYPEVQEYIEQERIVESSEEELETINFTEEELEELKKLDPQLAQQIEEMMKQKKKITPSETLQSEMQHDHSVEEKYGEEITQNLSEGNITTEMTLDEANEIVGKSK